MDVQATSNKKCTKLGAWSQWNLNTDIVDQWGEFGKPQVMSLEPGVTSQNLSNKPDQAWMNGTTKCKSSWLYVVIHKRPQVSCPGTFFYLGCKAGTFLQSTCQKQVLTGLQLETDRFQKAWK